MPVAAIPNFMTTLSSVFATLLGFIITAIALLASLLDKPLLKKHAKNRTLQASDDRCILHLLSFASVGVDMFDWVDAAK
ncbi:hypothetical protein NYV53_26050 [Escherichia coli]|uniref:hypothetical protein n=1 Tax=Escherichia coli TaxID=562 RepID=UPI002238963B|nr:hypothetical protein [Escherichia coli]MCW7095386.1 hypothetical protein [Escherichia coli]